MTDAVDAQASLEGVLKDEIIRMYEEVADNPDAEWLNRAPPGAVASFAGVGNPHASWHVGPTGKVIGVDLNPSMCLKAQAHAAATGTAIECHKARIEEIPLPNETVDVVISNGVINLSFRKRQVVEEMFRVLKPGGRISITDIVSAKQLSQSIVNDPKLWAS
jgi:SAM-dependent methyltransferase